MRKNSTYILPFLYVIFTVILFIGTIFSAKAYYSLSNFQESPGEANETATEAPTSTPSPTSTEEQFPPSSSTSTETESTFTSTSTPSYTIEPSLTPSPSPTDTVDTTPLVTLLEQNPSPTILPAFHYPYLRPPEGFKPKTGDLARPYLQAVASTWGSIDMDSNGKLNQPFDVDTDASGNVYVADAQNRRIKVYTPSGALLRQWGSWGDEEGQFYHPFSIAVDKYSGVGYVYVADDWTNEISKFDLYGNFLARWSISSNDWISALSVSPTTYELFVASNNAKVKILNPNNGNIISEHGPTFGSIYPITIYSISDIAIAPDGGIYISDESQAAVHKFDSSFNINRTVGSHPVMCHLEDNTFCGPIKLAVDSFSNVYAIDFTHRIQKFDSWLNFQSKFGSPGSGNGQFNFAGAISVSNSGAIYIADTFNHRIQKFSSNFTFQTKWGSDLTANGLLNLPQGIAINSNEVYIADTFNHRLQKFSHTGAFQAKWGSQGYGSYGYNPFSYTKVSDVAYDSSNNIYLIDQWDNRVIKTNPNGNLIRYYGREDGDSYGYGELQFNGPSSIAIDKNNNLYIAELGNHRIQVIDQNNQFVRFITFNFGECNDWGIGYEFTIAIDRNRDYLYVFNSNQNRVHQLSISNISATNPPYLIKVWGKSDCSWGSSLYEFSHPINGAVDSAGRLYVGDRWNAAVKVYDPTYDKFLGKWGNWGNGLGQFFELTDVTVDPNGYVYTIDNANGYRIQRFEPFFLDTAPPKPVLISPSSNVTHTFMPVYRWKTTPGAFRYELLIDAGEGKIFNPHPYCNADSCEVWLFTPLGAGTHTWKVRAANQNSTWGDWSNPMAFSISPNYPPNLSNLWGWSDSGSGKRMNWVFDLALDKTKQELYAPDARAGRVYKFDLNGNLKFTFGDCCGWENGWLSFPTGVAIDENTHDIYIADQEAGAIIKFNADGMYLGTYGRNGSNQMLAPTDIALDSAGNFYVIDARKYSLQKYNGNWDLLWESGSHGSDDGKFISPKSLAVIGNQVFVTDSEKQCVQVFNSDDGSFISKFGSFGTSASQFNNPWGITVDNNGKLLVGEFYNNRIQKFSTNGDFLSQFGSLGFANGQFSGPAGIAVDGSNNIYVSDAYQSRIQKFNSNGQFIAQWGTPPNAHLNGQLRLPLSLSINPQNDQIAVADAQNHQIQFFNLNGSFVGKLGAPGTNNGQFISPSAVAYDADRNLYVTDRGNHRIQKFSPSGEFLAQWGSYGEGNSQFKQPTQIYIDHNNDIYVSDQMNHRIQKFSSAGDFLMKFGEYGSEAGKFIYPWGVAVDSMGNIYVGDSTNRIQKFDKNGNYLAQWGGSGSENGKFYDAYGIFIDSHDALWIADALNHRIQVFAPNGDYLAKLSSSKAWYEIGRVYSPSSVALDSQNNIYITEPHLNRVQKFSPLFYPFPYVVPMLPPNLSQYNKPVYRWRHQSDITSYYIEVNKPNNKNLLSTVLIASSVCTSELCSYQPNITLPKGHYQFRVKAQFTNGLWGNFSAWQYFTVEPPAPPAAPVLQQPSGSTNTNQPAYTWQQVSGANSYYLIVYSYNNGSIILTQSGITNCSAGTCSFTQPAPLPSGYYGFKVRAANLQGWGAYSPWMNFRVLNQLLPVELITPANNAENISLKPTFSWKAISGATRYYLLVKDVNRGIYPVRRYIYCSSTTTCNFTLSTPLNSNTLYEYKIRAYSPTSSGWGSYSSSYRFTTQQ